MSKKFFLHAALILAFVAVLLTACGGGAGGGGPEFNAPTLDDLPDFPEGVIGAPKGTEADALAILEEIKNSGVLETFRINKWTVINNARNGAENKDNFTVNNKDGDKVRVYYKNASEEKLSSNFQKLMAFGDDPDPDLGEMMKLELTKSDSIHFGNTGESKTTVQANITNVKVAILKGSFTTSADAMEMGVNVTQGDRAINNFEDLKLTISAAVDSNRGIAMTLTTSLGAVKMLLIGKQTGSGSEKDRSLEDLEKMEDEDYTPGNYKENFDGTFTLYGAENAVLYRKELKSTADIEEELGDLLGLGKNITDL